MNKQTHAPVLAAKCVPMGNESICYRISRRDPAMVTYSRLMTRFVS